MIFPAIRDWSCTECGGSGDLLLMEEPGPSCLRCADMDHLIFLPSGDAARTRRARRASRLSAVVVRFSRSRRRYERQGILVEEAALEGARADCLADEEARSRRRLRERERRATRDVELQERMAQEILRWFPGCPGERALAIARHAAARGSGRVGRSAAGRALDPQAIALAGTASVRHVDTTRRGIYRNRYTVGVSDVAAVIRRARTGARLSQVELAERAGTSQPALARYETGAALPTLPTLERLLLACGRRLRIRTVEADGRSAQATSVRGQLGPRARDLRRHRRRLLDAARARGVRRVRVFGSLARGEDVAASDIDLLVDLEPGKTLVDLTAFRREAAEILERPVDVATPDMLKERIRSDVLAEALPL